MSNSDETPRERLVRTASDLFYRDGVTATGVNRVTARSGVSKPTLYAHFGSKDELVAAAMQRRHEEQLASWEAETRAVEDSPDARILAVFDWLVRLHDSPGFRGCAFLRAAGELPESAPATAVIRRQKSWMRDYLTGLAREASAADAENLGEELMILIDGANSRALVEGPRRAARDARRMALTLLRQDRRRTSARP